ALPIYERVRANLDSNVVRRSAFEGLPVDRTDEGNDDTVAGLSLGALALRVERPVLRDKALESLVDLIVRHRSHRPLKLDRPQVGDLDLRQDFEGQRICKVRIPLDQSLDLALVARKRDLRLHGDAES